MYLLSILYLTETLIYLNNYIKTRNLAKKLQGFLFFINRSRAVLLIKQW